MSRGCFECCDGISGVCVAWTFQFQFNTAQFRAGDLVYIFPPVAGWGLLSESLRHDRLVPLFLLFVVNYWITLFREIRIPP